LLVDAAAAARQRRRAFAAIQRFAAAVGQRTASGAEIGAAARSTRVRSATVLTTAPANLAVRTRSAFEHTTAAVGCSTAFGIEILASDALATRALRYGRIVRVAAADRGLSIEVVVSGEHAATGDHAKQQRSDHGAHDQHQNWLR
jgi:hypothetical protein